MARIDHAYIKAAIEGRLGDSLDGSDVRFVRSGDSPPDGVDAWAQLVAVDIAPVARHRANGVDRCTLTATVNVAVGGDQANAHALEGALALVARALDEWTDDDAATTGHLVELERASVASDPGPFEARELRTGSVSVDGTAQRPSGLSFLDFLS